MRAFSGIVDLPALLIVLAALFIIGGIAAVRAATILVNLPHSSTPVAVLPAALGNDIGCGVEVSLGFDTAARTASQLVGNMATDCNLKLDV